MTILTAIQEACPIVSIATPIAVLSSNDTTARKLLALAYQAGDDIARRGDWSKLISTAVATTGALPADFQRLVTGAAVRRTSPTLYHLRGPLSTEQIQAMAMFGTSAVLGYGIQGGQLVFSRALAGETISIDYVSTNWIRNGATPVRRAISDNDTLVFPDDLMTKGVIWRWKRSIGLPYQDEMAEFEADLAFHLKQDRGVTT